MQIRIKIRGKLDKQWTKWFENLEIKYEDGNTILVGEIKDQSALHGILNQIRDLNLKLISVNVDNERYNNK